jgi:hypothetical protein
MGIVDRKRPVWLVRSPRPVDESTDQSFCLACGEALPPLLRDTGSVRCHDCRDEMAPLRAELVEPPEPEIQAA